MRTATATKSVRKPAATQRAGSKKNALAKLKSDHDAVKKLFSQYERSKDKATSQEKLSLVTRICGELEVHTQIEEEIFYPAIRAVQTDKLEELLDEAEVEHAGAKDLIAQLKAAKPADRLYDAKVSVLGEEVKHHAGEEENEMFSKIRRIKNLDLEELGMQLIERAEELKQQKSLN